MNLTERYSKQAYIIDTENFYLVKIIDGSGDNWSTGRVGEIFVTFKWSNFSGRCLMFPQLLTDLRTRADGIPMISTLDATTINGEIIPATGAVLKTGITFQKPINWLDYLEVKKEKPDKIDGNYASEYSNSLYDKELQ